MDTRKNAAENFITTGFPMPGEKVIVVRKSGKKLIARLSVAPNLPLRDCKNMHWLTDDDLFADVPFDPIIDWYR